MKKLIFILMFLFPLLVIGQTYKNVQGNNYYKGLSKFAKEVVSEDTLRISKGIVYPDGTIGTTGFLSGDTVSIDSLLYIPHIYYDNGDTSNFAVPFKIGDMYIDVQNSKIYISWSPIRGGWIKLN